MFYRICCGSASEIDLSSVPCSSSLLLNSPTHVSQMSASRCLPRAGIFSWACRTAFPVFGGSVSACSTPSVLTRAAPFVVHPASALFCFSKKEDGQQGQIRYGMKQISERWRWVVRFMDDRVWGVEAQMERSTLNRRRARRLNVPNPANRQLVRRSRPLPCHHPS